MKRCNNPLAQFGMAIALGTFWPAAHAQVSEWPNKPIRMVMPLAAGGTTDAAARVIAAQLVAAHRRDAGAEAMWIFAR